jgi:diguanylate cyclase (GGDEF)-like protein
MIVYPAIDIRGGKVVRLQYGDPARQTVYGDDPVAVAQRWKEAGAHWLHVVNLDGALGQDAPILDTVRRLAATGMAIQFGGGLRSLDAAEQALAALARSEGTCLALLFVDLDGFKEINDRHGHAVGDRMLEKIAGRLAELVRESDTVARHGGDEFVVLLRDLETTEEAELVARRICEGAGGVEPVEASPTGLTVSVGVTLVADGGDPRAMSVESVVADPDEALRRADRAMYRAKQQGGSSYWVHRAGEEIGGS